MSARLRLSFWLSVAAVAVAGLLSVAVPRGPAADDPPRPAANRAEGGTAPAPTATPHEDMLPADWVKALSWRCLGPANMGGRITALAVCEADPCTYWVATAGGGLLRTVNNGVTFEHQFDREATVSIGDVCVAPSSKDVVWVGTGEANPRNSVSYGDGVYKSTDGGKSWKNVGLKKSFQIGRIVIHPSNPDVVYVGALGRLYGPSEERGLYKTIDGGTTWQRVLFVDDKTGVIDLRMNPANPEELVVATYERQRDGFDGNEPAKRYGPGAGIWKTNDAGKTFRRSARGLPSCQLGRIGLDWYHKDPRVVYAILESEKSGMGPPGAAAVGTGYVGLQGEDPREGRGAEITDVVADGPADKAGLKPGDVVTRVGDKAVTSYQDLLATLRGHNADDKVKVRLLRNKEEKEIEVTFGPRPAGGRAGFGGGGAPDPNRPFGAPFAGQQENAQDRQGPDGFQYGGVYRSADAGESWERINSINPRPMYFSQVRVDPSDERYLYVLGVSMARSTDGGRTFRTEVRRGPEAATGIHSDQHALWIDPKDGRHLIVGCDGGFYATYDRTANWDHLNHLAIGQFYHVAIDTRRDYKVYGGLQDNGTWGGPSRTHGGLGPVNEDWVSVGGGDGFRCAVDPNDPDQVYWSSQNGNLGRRNLRTGEAGFIRPQAPRGQTYRWNWNTPFILSHHNSRIYYCAGNHVFRSLDRGDNPQAISPEITATKQGSASALAESPKNPNVLYAGTDDGNLWMTRDGGREWTNITKNVGLPGLRWVASIEASRYEEGRCYVAFDGHRSDDDEPYVYVTEDFGKTWKSRRANLPWGSTRVLREDIANPDLLFLGTEFGAWASLDRGASWTRINNNLPTVAVHEFAIHPTAGEVVIATHGRSLWVCDVSALRQITPEARKAAAFLYKPTSAVRLRPDPAHGRTNRRFVGENPANPTTIYYSLTKKADKATLAVVDIEGKTVRELQASTSAGLHAVGWNLTTAFRPQQPVAARQPSAGAARPEGVGPPEGAGRGQGGGRFARGGGFGRPVPAGSYRIVLTVDGKEYQQSIHVEGDAVTAPPNIAEDDDDNEEEAIDP
jgi:photosystem II stability/assembly factor-like uncharacterized protein